MSNDIVNHICFNSDRSQKGGSLVIFPEDFVVIDTETTGLSPVFDDIIEFAGIRVRGGLPVERYATLIKPPYPVSSFITELTGITNEMLEDAPRIEDVASDILRFLGEDVLVGHNVNFDIDFLYDNIGAVLGEPIKNNYVDTLRLARKALPELGPHRLSDIAAALQVPQESAHRAIEDCVTTLNCFSALHDLVLSKMSAEEFAASFKRKRHGWNYDLTQIQATGEDFDDTHPLYQKHCVFTGALERMKRSAAAQIVVNLGGICENDITKKTNFLILGNNDYNPLVRDGKSKKQKKAEAYRLAGQDIEIIPEAVFYELIER